MVTTSMSKPRIVTNLSECRLLWERFIPQETLWDMWDVRACFHRHFQRPLCFIVAEGAHGETGFLPLSRVDEAGCYQYFPGETWHGATWLEQNRIVADSAAMTQALLESCPGTYHLRYLTPNPAVPTMQKTVDEIGYRFLPPQYAYDLQNYFHEFSGKSVKRLKRELAALESLGVEYRCNVLSDFDRMLAMNLERFGARSYFHDPRFLESFRSLLGLAQARGWLSLTSLHLGGNPAAIDLGVVVNGVYTLLGGGTQAEYPGVAKLINMHHMQRACTERHQAADFLSGDFSWKKLFHLTPQPLYLLSNASLAAVAPATAPIPATQRVAVEIPDKTDRKRVLVIGTTSDYIHHIGRHYPGRAVFITDPAERGRAKEPPLDPACEVLCKLEQPEAGLEAIRRHLAHYDLRASGVACFDCESMALASFVARDLSLPYPSAEAVTACRSKFIAKQRWQRAGLACPAASPIESVEEAVRFFDRCRGKKAVLKPLTGSGSELVFVCATADACVRAFDAIRRRLAGQSNARMYAPYEHEGQRVDPRHTVLMEEFVEGPEYSCDFMIDHGAVEIIRVARKWPQTNQTPGTIQAYVLPESPPGLTPETLARQFSTAAQAVGIERAICMVDFIMEQDRLVLLEIAPRPGGDCLPGLIRLSSGLDMLALALDFAERRPISIPPPAQWQRLVGLRFLTSRAGVIGAIGADEVRRDPRVLEVAITRGPGHRVLQPPDDFDSRILGHAVFRPCAPDAVAAECREVAAKLSIEFAAGART